MATTYRSVGVADLRPDPDDGRDEGREMDDPRAPEMEDVDARRVRGSLPNAGSTRDGFFTVSEKDRFVGLGTLKE